MAFDALISAAASRYQVPASWIRAVIATESSWDPDAINPADPSYGLMQITAPTARGLGFTGRIPADLMDPETNIEVGTQLLAELRGRYGDNFADIYSAYNSGDPDLWRTNAQVRRNTERALGWLDKYKEGIAAGGLAVLAALWILVAWGFRYDV